MQLCYLCKEWYDPTTEDLEAYAEAGYDWDHVNWICPACGEALKSLPMEDANFMLSYEGEEDYEHPF